MESSQKNRLHRYWGAGPVQKAIVTASSVLIFMCLCCSGIFVYSQTPAGKAFVSAVNATSTAEANATATQNAIYALTPHPTNIPRSTSTRVPTSTLQPTQKPTAILTLTPTPKPTNTSVPSGSGYPHVGGPYSDFPAKYGDPASINGSSHNFYLDDTHSNFLGVTTNGTTVTSVAVLGSSSWSDAKTFDMCALFLPNDAVKYNAVSNLTDYHSSVGMVVIRNDGQGVCQIYLGQG